MLSLVVLQLHLLIFRKRCIECMLGLRLLDVFWVQRTREKARCGEHTDVFASDHLECGHSGVHVCMEAFVQGAGLALIMHGGYPSSLPSFIECAASVPDPCIREGCVRKMKIF